VPVGALPSVTVAGLVAAGMVLVGVVAQERMDRS
jgi:hypothetical protein